MALEKDASLSSLGDRGSCVGGKKAAWKLMKSVRVGKKPEQQEFSELQAEAWTQDQSLAAKPGKATSEDKLLAVKKQC
eukprot:145043-Pelagomonas_calceolata.AAC.2